MNKPLTVADILQRAVRAKTELKPIIPEKQLNAIEWKTVARVVLFEEQTCNRCGAVHYSFHGHFVESKKNDGSSDLKRGVAPDHFPLEKRLIKNNTPICFACEQGEDSGAIIERKLS